MCPITKPSEIMVSSYRKTILLNFLMQRPKHKFPSTVSPDIKNALEALCIEYSTFVQELISAKSESACQEILSKYANNFKKNGDFGLASKSVSFWVVGKLKSLSEVYLTISLSKLSESIGLNLEETKKILFECVSLYLFSACLTL